MDFKELKKRFHEKDEKFSSQFYKIDKTNGVKRISKGKVIPIWFLTIFISFIIAFLVIGLFSTGTNTSNSLSENNIEQQNPTQIVTIDSYRFEIPKNYTLTYSDELEAMMFKEFSDENEKYVLGITLVHLKKGVDFFSKVKPDTKRGNYNGVDGYLSIEANETTFMFQKNNVIITYTTNSSDYNAVFSNVTFLGE